MLAGYSGVYEIMELPEVLKSKKAGIGISCLAALVALGAETWQIMTVGIVGIIVQGILDLKRKRDGK